MTFENTQYGKPKNNKMKVTLVHFAVILHRQEAVSVNSMERKSHNQ